LFDVESPRRIVDTRIQHHHDDDTEWYGSQTRRRRKAPSSNILAALSYSQKAPDYSLEGYKEHPPRQSSSLLSAKLVYLGLLLSWLTCWVSTSQTRETLLHVQRQDLTSQLHVERVSKELQDARSVSREVMKEVKQFKKMQASFEHEARVFQELSEAGVRMYLLPEHAAAASEVVQDWLMERLEGLHRKLDVLTSYLQRMSRLSVVSQYGPGPHRIQVTVEMNDVSRRQSSFVMELASIEVMPHSVHLFLDLVTAKVWDNTIFLHHENVEHVLAATPVDYSTQQVRREQLEDLGLHLGFPEYSKLYPHEVYTVGMAGLGPSFYVNVIDNSKWHGPGGQRGRSLFPDDADPCFARVVDGFSVLDELVSFGAKLKEQQEENDNWTRIVSLRLQ
jgi:cyclophilin family peptidyl-prolyl cis-trans isomerase